MEENTYIDESKLQHHVVYLSYLERQKLSLMGEREAFALLCDKGHCHPQQVYRVSWTEDVARGAIEYILDVDPARIIVEAKQQ